MTILPSFDELFLLTDPCTPAAFRAEVQVHDCDPAALTRAEQTPPKRLAARWAMGRPKPSDFVFTTLGTLYLVSPRVLSLFAEIKASGWRQYPVSLRDKLDAVVAGYAGLAVTGRCGPALSSRSMRVEMTMPGGVFPIWKGMYFDEASWDGSDVFTFPGTAMVVVVERVRRALERAKVRNLEFVSLDEIERSEVEMAIAREREQAAAPPRRPP